MRRLLLSCGLLTLAVVQAVPRESAIAVAMGTHQATAAPAPVPARYVDRDRLMRDVSTLASPAFEGRQAGTAGGLKAREWIVEQFGSIGLTPTRGRGYVQPFTFAPRNPRAILPGGIPARTEYPGANVVGRVDGSDPRAGTIVVTAHYDHLGVRDGVLYPGADDNASGVAALLAVARYFRMAAPRHTVVFAALDAEEPGLHGARTLVASEVLPRGRTRLDINLDMVSRSDANEIYAAGPYHAPWERPILDEVQGRAAVKLLFGHDRPARLANGLEDWTHSSDHGPFHDAGIPFVYFGVEDHPDYHKPTDTADRIDARFFGDAADMIVDAIRTFDARLP
jgi:peptidase M28-like protein